MATLYKRASSEQRKILRMVEGAVKNAAHAHPEFVVSERFARSVAKRAVGRISAQLPGLRASVERSMSPSRNSLTCLQPVPAQSQHPKPAQGGATLARRPRSPFKLLKTRLSLMAGWARKAGHIERANAFADALRVVDSLEKELNKS